MAISNYIRETLLFYNSAVLPGFGAFEIINEPAETTPGRLTPPKSKLIFNKENILNDNILSSKIVEAEDISPEMAREKIQKFIDEIRFRLYKEEGYEIKGVGILYKDENNDFQINKDEGLNIDLGNYGLESFELDSGPDEKEESAEKEVLKKEVPREVKVQEKAKLTSEKISQEITVPSEDTKKHNRNTIWVLSGSVVVVLIAFVIIALTTDLFDNNTGVFKLFSVQEKPAEVKDDFKSAEEDDFDFDAMVSEMDKDIDSLTSMENALDFTNSEAVDEASENVYAEYHLITGSFSSKANAEALSQQLTLEGFPAMVIDRGDGFYRVSAISYRNKQEALKELFKFRKRKDMANAWLLGLR